MRRIILAGLALVAAATVFDIPAADAQVSSGRNPYCIRDGVGGPGSWDCSYHNLAQCRRARAAPAAAAPPTRTTPAAADARRRTRPADNTWDGGTCGWGGGRW